MRDLVRLALAPALRVARASLEEAELGAPFPDGPPRAHAPGADPSRILIVGNGAALGVGVRSHGLALPGALAWSISSQTGTGVDVDLVADARLSLLRVVDAVRSNQPDRYDCIVVVSGGDEALGLLPPTAWRRNLMTVLRDLRALIGPSTPVILTGVPANHLTRPLPAWIARLADAHAAQLDAVSLSVCGSSTNVHFVALTPPRASADRPRASDDFARWGRLIAAEVVSNFAYLPREGAGSGIDEPRRQSAVDLLGLTDSGADPRLRHITDMARLAFGTETALFTVLDRDIQLHAARSGTDLTRIPRGDSFCQYTILERGGMIVEDALNDDRFRENPLVTGEPHIRFYAGFPVDSPDGERVGALCIFDSSPRRADEVDTSLLRDLAHLVQRELWRYLPETAAHDSRLRLLTRSWTLPRIAQLYRPIRTETDVS